MILSILAASGAGIYFIMRRRPEAREEERSRRHRELQGNTRTDEEAARGKREK